MKLQHLCHILGSLTSYYVFKKRSPLTVSFLSTYTCNQKCSYCDWTKLDSSSMNTEEALVLIKSLKKSGVIKLGFAGGESLFRNDIDLLLECAHKEGLITSISTNGREIKKHIDAIEKYVDVVQLSLDGRQDTHDMMRGEGSYKIVVNAIELLRNKKVKVITNTVITKRNINELDEVLRLANKYGYKALFQPIFYYKISEGKGVIDKLRPSYYEMYYAIEYLIKQKLHYGSVGNSIAFLKYIQKSWGNKLKVKCHANDLFCTIDPLGYILPCCFDNDKKNEYNAVKLGFEEAFRNSIKNDFSKNCFGCYCNAYIESDLAFSFHISACINALGII